MYEKVSAFWLIKLLAIIMGGIICLILSGDIDADGKIKINRYVILKFLCSVVLGLFCGEFIIDYLDWEHLNHFAQGFILMSLSVFGMLIVGILYQSIRFTFSDKTLSEIVEELKKAVTAILK